MIKKPAQSLQNLSSSCPDNFSTKIDQPKSIKSHIKEMRNSFLWVVLALCVGGFTSYLFHTQLIDIVQQPLGKTLFFTSPAGGLNFLIKLCFTFAVIFVLPVLMYQIVKFFYPLMEKGHKRAVIPFIVSSIILAYAGVVFAYLVSLPNALSFLSNFGGQNIEALITADEYYDFVLAYLLGFALMFQIPVIVLFINKIKPQKPGKMMGIQRYIILGSFIIAAILTPTPDPVNQTIMAAPAVVLYQFAVLCVWRINKKNNNLDFVIMKNMPDSLFNNSNVEYVTRRFNPKIIGAFTTKKAAKLQLITNKPKSTLRAPRVFTDFTRPIERSLPRANDIVNYRSSVSPGFRTMDIISA
jgi:sec-independent protein translocase protein TatC